MTSLVYVPYSWKFLPGEKFRQFHHLVLLMKICCANFLSCVNGYVEDMATFSVLVKIYFTEYRRSGNFHVSCTINFCVGNFDPLPR